MDITQITQFTAADAEVGTPGKPVLGLATYIADFAYYSGSAHVKSGFSKDVPMNALRARRASGSMETFFAARVFGEGHCLQMVWINAAPISTQMVYRKPVWDRAEGTNIGNPMCKFLTMSAVAGGRNVAGPFVTTVGSDRNSVFKRKAQLMNIAGFGH